MEKLNFQLASNLREHHQQPVICGVVGSGNLEILVSCSQDSQHCTIDINTSAVGFAHVWEAVLTEFAQRHSVAGLRFQLNDMGATPAVVTLRLSQAVTMLQGAAHA